MMTETDDLTLTVSRLIPAAPERVFNAWLDPKMLAQFMLAGSGMGCRAAATDPRIGGRYNIVMTDGEKDIPHGGTYLEIAPHKRLAFTWVSPHAAPGSMVALDFTPEKGGTRLTLTQVKFNSESSRDGHRKGWTAILETLDNFLRAA
jgi:uncharacterized protein YndB with AHSA1/START domain